MPHLYINDPRVDLLDLERAWELANTPDDASWTPWARKELAELLAPARAWLAVHPKPGDYASR